MAKVIITVVLITVVVLLCVQTAYFIAKIKQLEERLAIVESQQSTNTTTKTSLNEIPKTVAPKTETPVKTTAMTSPKTPQQSTGTTTMVSPKQFPSRLEHYDNDERQSGVYTIYPQGLPVQVYCDMYTDGGGWTVFQRRQDGSENFYRTWADYASGFGNLTGELWLGNDLISALTSNGPHELRIDMGDFEGDSAYAKYGTFRLSSQVDKYTLEVSEFSGDAGDSLSYHDGAAFSTKDQDNDDPPLFSCARRCTGAWWYKWCYNSNLNGPYGHGHGDRGIIWQHWKSLTDPLKNVEMKFRAKA